MAPPGAARLDRSRPMSSQDRTGESFYRAIVENSADAIALLDRDGTILFVTESVERLSGFGADVVIGTNSFEQIHPEDEARARPSFEECPRQRGNRVSVEYRACQIDGAWQHREAVGVNRLDDPAIRAVVVTYRDITDRKRTERALAESERVFALTFDEAPIGIAHTSLRGRWLRVNRRLCELLGYSPEELMATSFIAMTHPEDVDRDTRGLAQLLARANTHYDSGKS